MTKAKAFRIVGVIGTALFVYYFATHLSWPTPDKLLVFLIFVFMMFGQGWAVAKRLIPFVGLLLVYESFRGLVPSLNNSVHYQFMIIADRGMFGTLPTTLLQNWLWHGHVQWYDFGLYFVYTLHFILPLGMAILIWKTREKMYWRFVTTFLVVSFAGFLTFLAFPASPPWLAAQKGYIEPITRVSSELWGHLGVKDFPTVYNKISPNPVAAVPSLHAAYATLLFIFVYKLYGKKWAALAFIYPFLIYFGTVYQGEHYLIDEIIGSLYAIGSYAVVSVVWTHFKPEKKLKKIIS